MNFNNILNQKIPNVHFTYSVIDLSVDISLASLLTINVLAVSIQRDCVFGRKGIDSGGRRAEFWELNEVKCFDLETDTKQSGLTVAPRAVHNNGSVQPCGGACLRLMSLHVLLNYFNYLIMYQIYSWKHREIGSNLRTNRSILRRLCSVYKSFRR